MPGCHGTQRCPSARPLVHPELDIGSVSAPCLLVRRLGLSDEPMDGGARPAVLSPDDATPTDKAPADDAQAPMTCLGNLRIQWQRK